MGYDGSWTIGNRSAWEPKVSGQYSLVYANAISAIRGVTLSLEELKSRISEISMSYRTSGLKSLLEMNSQYQMLFDYFNGELTLPRLKSWDSRFIDHSIWVETLMSYMVSTSLNFRMSCGTI